MHEPEDPGGPGPGEQFRDPGRLARGRGDAGLGDQDRIAGETPDR
jgi:hypothetical protein